MTEELIDLLIEKSLKVADQPIFQLVSAGKVMCKLFIS